MSGKPGTFSDCPPSIADDLSPPRPAIARRRGIARDSARGRGKAQGCAVGGGRRPKRAAPPPSPTTPGGNPRPPLCPAPAVSDGAEGGALQTVDNCRGGGRKRQERRPSSGERAGARPARGGRPEGGGEAFWKAQIFDAQKRVPKPRSAHARSHLWSMPPDRHAVSSSTRAETHLCADPLALEPPHARAHSPCERGEYCSASSWPAARAARSSPRVAAEPGLDRALKSPRRAALALRGCLYGGK